MNGKIGLFSVLIVSLLLSACSSPAPAQPAAAAPAVTQAPTAELLPTATLDPCSPQYERILAQRVHSHMREFDDASSLAAALNSSQLPTAIADLQRIRRASQDEPVPACLGKLKELEVAHMNMVINTLLAMLNGAQPADLQTGIGNARNLHDAYTMEFAAVMGLTVVAPPTSAPDTALTETPAAATTVSNPGPESVNLRDTPSLSGAIVALLPSKVSAVVFGKSADGTWVQVEVPEKPGEMAWVFRQNVRLLTGTLDAVPVVTP